MKASDRCNAIKPLPTVVIKQKCAEMKAAGKDIIDLSIGDTDFMAPASLTQGVQKALENGKTHYTATTGIKELREELAERHKADFSEILVSVGGKEGVCSLFLAMVNEGDEVVFPEPAWPAYRAYSAMCGAEVKNIPTSVENNFEPTIDSLHENVSNKTKLVAINSPNNPTGASYQKEFIKAAAELADDYGFILLSDEIYSNYDYEERFVSARGMGENVVVLDGYSKTFAATGLRVCYLVGNKELIKQVNKIHAYNVGNAPSAVQYGVLGLYNEKKYMEKNHKEMKSRNDLVYDVLKETPGLEISKSKGAFYLFPKYSLNMSSVELCADILEQQEVGLVPGSAFGGEEHFRIAYSQPKHILEQGTKRINDYFEAKQ